jgi:hypothetical protein
MLISQLYNLNLAMLIQIWAPQTIELIKWVERVQNRATKFILNLPFHSEVPTKNV